MSTQNGDALSPKALFYMFLLSIQFGVQPMLSKRFTPTSVCRSSVILVQEAVKFVIASTMLYSTGELKEAISGWTVASWVKVAAVPAALYSVQNLAALLAYQNLDALTFNVLNQTKTLSAALCCYFVIGRKQSKIQVLALLLLLGSALVIEKVITVDSLVSLVSFPSPSSSASASEPESVLPLMEEEIKKPFFGQNILKGFGKKKVAFEEEEEQTLDTGNDSPISMHITHGVLPVLLASFISGLAGAISQKNLQSSSGRDNKKTKGRNAYLFSMELCVASTIFLGVTLLGSEDGKLISSHGFFHNWNYKTLIPIILNACGGIIVGLVTKYAGSVRKGFALIFGILLSGILQAMVGIGEKAENTVVTKEQIFGGIMAGISLWAHATHPYVPSTTIKLDDSSKQNNIPSRDSKPPEGKTIRRSNRKARKED